MSGPVSDSGMEVIRKSAEVVDSTSYALRTTLVSSSAMGLLGISFSYKTIPSGDIIAIPLNQQMVVVGTLTIAGTLILTGDLAVIF